MVDARRHDADYRVRLRIEHDLAAENIGRPAELPPPQPVAEDHHVAVAGPFF